MYIKPLSEREKFLLFVCLCSALLQKVIFVFFEFCCSLFFFL